ncbi:C4-dicarboxylate ABC transporter permease [Roseovarius sp. TE539]|uniref:TRAP transporter large permease n=1 Tax=Roseovarius sp. TE539 TaxID=2249812 RepID=UPI000DDD22DC|nr:TRAP transporter large permease [Roseovarius sp. TE539]RBI70601.1 C4-dicarboxylate ABC transporter permease [Roseovarius sp. TE539]
MLSATLGFLAAFALIFLRVPIALSLGLAGAVGYALLVGVKPALSMIGMSAVSSTLSYNLAVIPLFILMGNLIAGAGIAKELYRTAQAYVGHLKGGLGVATILSCGGFAAVCGSSVATAVTMGKVAIPSMREFGYSDRLATATVAAGGTLGILIPPSIIMVVYGISTETSIGELFAAGVIPGLVGIVGYSLAVRYTLYRHPDAAPDVERASRAERRATLRKTWSVAVLFAVVLGGIYAGLFTATEAAGIGASGALVFAIIRRMPWREFLRILVESAETTAVLFALIIGAKVFAEFVNYSGAHHGVLSFVQDSGFSPAMVMLVICLIYILLGCLLDSLAMMLLTLPMFFPIVVGLGYDPVWFGVMVVMLVELGLITPPIGINLFILKSVVPEVPLGTIIRGILPFVLADLGRLLLIGLVPTLALALPRLFF